MSVMFFALFLILMTLGLPVLFALAIPPIIQLIATDQMLFYSSMYTKVVTSLENFTLLALPFFILAGAIMGKGKITERIVSFSQSMVGHYTGSLGHVVVLAAAIFSALTGSAVAAMSALGSMLIPSMEKNGFPKDYAAAVTATAAVLGPIIPPSGIMLIYAFVMNISIGEMFLAGVVPGIIFVIVLMTINFLQCKRHGYTYKMPKATAKERWNSFKHSFLAILMPVIILGGIYGGIFTPTEAAAASVGYALIITLFVFKSINLKALFKMFHEVAISSASILLIVAAASGFAVIVSLSPISHIINSAIGLLNNNIYLAFFLINILLFIIGMFLDAGPAILIFAPILAPPLIAMGVDPLHFGVVMSINVTIGLVTPPMGLVLFVASDITGLSLERIAKKSAPFIVGEILVIFLITFFPVLVTGLPFALR